MDMKVFEASAGKLLEEHPGDERGRMLHSPGLKTAGKFYAFVTGEDLIVKLPAARVTELIATRVGRLCEPRQGRPMKQWVRLTPASEDVCTAYLVEARESIVDLPKQ